MYYYNYYFGHVKQRYKPNYYFFFL